MKMESKEKVIIPGCEEKEHKGNSVGCLLIHGFRSCPFEMQEFANYLNKLGFTTKTILLPGHGTDPADLLNVNWMDWVKSVDNALKSLKRKCNKILLLDYRQGGP